MKYMRSLNNRVSNSLFSQIKQQYDIIKMRAAYISAEQYIIKNSETGMADGVTFFESRPKEEYETIQFEMNEQGMMEQLTVKDLQIRKLEGQLKELEELGRKLLDEEKYELMDEARELYTRTAQQLHKLRST